MDLSPVIEIIVREQNLHKVFSPSLQLMLKLNGRPFWGKLYFVYSLFHSAKCAKSNMILVLFYFKAPLLLAIFIAAAYANILIFLQTIFTWI